MLRLNSNENRGNNFTIKENDNKKEIRKEGFFWKYWEFKILFGWSLEVRLWVVQVVDLFQSKVNCLLQIFLAPVPVPPLSFWVLDICEWLPIILLMTLIRETAKKP